MVGMFYLLPSIKDNVSPHEWKKIVSELDSQMHLKQCRLNITVRDGHGGGWSRKINARYLHTLMVYL